MWVLYPAELAYRPVGHPASLPLILLPAPGKLIGVFLGETVCQPGVMINSIFYFSLNEYKPLFEFRFVEGRILSLV